jgi:DNA topoisomerase-1
LILDFPDAGIQVLNGRYGPYITDKARNAKIPKERDPKTLTLPECQSMLAAAPARTFGKWGRKNKAGAKAAPAKGGAKAGAAADRATGQGSAAGAGAAAGTGKVPPKAGSAPQRLAAKGLKSAAKKRAPVEPSATPKAASSGTPKPAPKAAPKAASKPAPAPTARAAKAPKGSAPEVSPKGLPRGSPRG